MQDSKQTPVVNENSGVSWLDKPFFVTLFRSVQNPQGRRTETTLRALAQRWQKPPVVMLKQLVPGWSPALFTGDRRASAGVESVGALVLDYEPASCAMPRGAPCLEGYSPTLGPSRECEAYGSLDEDCAGEGARCVGGDSYVSGTQIADCCDDLRGMGLGFVLHTSYSHVDPRKGSAPRFRLVLPLSRPALPGEYAGLWAAAVAMLEYMGHQIDPKAKDASRFWFDAAKRDADAPYVVQVDEGGVLDVDALLSLAETITPSPEVLAANRAPDPPAPITPRLSPPSSPRSASPGRRAPGEAPPEGTPARARYAEAALARAEQAVRQAPLGKRSDTLNQEAYSIAGLIGPELSESTVYNRLLAATIRWDNPGKTVATLRRAIDAGKLAPRRGVSRGGTGEGPAPSMGSWSMPARAEAGAAPDEARFDEDGVQIEDAPASGQTPPPADGGYPADGGEPQDDRPVVQITVDRHLALDATIVHLAQRADIYQRNGKLVESVEEWLASPGGQPKKAPPQIREVSKPRLAELLSRAIRFEAFKPGSNGNPGDFELCAAPGWLVDQVIDRGAWPCIRPLRNVASSPVLRADGTILSEPGYDPETGLLYAPQRAFLPVPEEASLDDAKAAVGLLFELVKDFPFETKAHRSAWLAALLTPLARHAFEGPAPFMLIEANTRGSGKSKLAYIIGLVVTGNVPENLSYSNDDTEMDKRLLSIAKAGDQLSYFDNIDIPLGNGPLNNALTTTRYRGRLLGGNDMAAFDLLTTFMGSGNNVQFGADMARRVLATRLQSPEQNPEKRKVSDPKILATVALRRAEYLAAALTILRAWFVAGKPTADFPGWGSCEGWSDLVRNVIVWVGQPDPGQTRDSLAQNGDTEGQMLEMLIEGWSLLQDAKERPDGLTTMEVLDDLSSFPKENMGLREAICTLCNAKPGQLPSSRALAGRLSHLRDRVYEGRCLKNGGRSKKGALWTVGNAPTPEEWAEREVEAAASRETAGGES